MTEMKKKDDESLATYIYRVCNKNYNEMNPKGFQNFLDQMRITKILMQKMKMEKVTALKLLPHQLGLQDHFGTQSLLKIMRKNSLIY